MATQASSLSTISYQQYPTQTILSLLKLDKIDTETQTKDMKSLKEELQSLPTSLIQNLEAFQNLVDAHIPLLLDTSKNLHHEHDLMHKANGWLLREMGKKDEQELLNFLNLHYQKMPRTTLRYAIEKLDEDLRQDYLKSRM
jgi:3-methyladenine DNA glycosylase AlkD